MWQAQGDAPNTFRTMRSLSIPQNGIGGFYLRRRPLYPTELRGRIQKIFNFQAQPDSNELPLRRLVLYPTELLGHISKIFNFSAQTDSNELPLRRRSLYPAELRVLMPSAAESAPGKKGGLSLLSSTWPDMHNRQPIIEESREKVNPLVSYHIWQHPASGLLSHPAKYPCSAPRGSPVHPQEQTWSCPPHPKARCAKPYCRSSPPPGHSFPLR